MRNAGTMLTSAQNGGRIDSYKRAESMGIKLKKMWLATLDGHVRTSHRMLDGEVKGNDEAFSNGCMFPGDPKGAPEEIYNCRCTLITQLNGYEIDPTNLDLREHSGLKGMPYEEWKIAKGDEPIFKAARNRKQDEKQFEEYQKLLGKMNIPKDIDAFQDIKYNTPEKWEELKKQARIARIPVDKRQGSSIIRDKRITDAIANGDITLTLNPEKQLPHILGSSKYNQANNKSYFVLSQNDVQELINKYHGMGIVIEKRGQYKEIIHLSYDIGHNISANGVDLGSTNTFTIHYSKSRKEQIAQ